MYEVLYETSTVMCHGGAVTLMSKLTTCTDLTIAELVHIPATDRIVLIHILIRVRPVGGLLCLRLVLVLVLVLIVLIVIAKVAVRQIHTLPIRIDILDIADILDLVPPILEDFPSVRPVSKLHFPAGFDPINVHACLDVRASKDTEGYGPPAEVAKVAPCPTSTNVALSRRMFESPRQCSEMHQLFLGRGVEVCPDQHAASTGRFPRGRIGQKRSRRDIEGDGVRGAERIVVKHELDLGEGWVSIKTPDERRTNVTGIVGLRRDTERDVLGAR